MNKFFTERDRLFIILVSLLVVFMWIASSMLFAKDGVLRYSSGNKEIVTLKPTKVIETNQKNSKKKQSKYYFDGRVIEKNGGCIQFYTLYQEIKVIEIDKKGKKNTVYEVKKSTSPFGRNSGVRHNFSEISKDAKEVVVELRYDFDIDSKPIRFKCGEESNLYFNIVINNISNQVLVSIEMLLGMYIIMSFWFVGYKRQRQKVILYYGTLLLYMGMWCSLEIDVINMMFDNYSAVYFMIYGILLTAPIPFILFIDSYYEVKSNRVSEGIKIVSAIQAMIMAILQLVGKIELREYLTLIQIELTVMNLYLVYVSYLTIKNNKDTIYRIEKIVETCGLLLGYVLAVLSYRMLHFENNIYVLIVVVVYSIGVWYNITKRELLKDEENKRIEIYRSQAEYDILTNVKNRNSFENFMYDLKEYSGYAVCVFDLNNLKVCNDTYGHKAGDRLIVACANCIKDVFDKLGDVYRIGGDEFCVIFKCGNKKEIEILLDDMQTLQNQYNKTTRTVKVEVAAGYAIFSPRYDDNLENTFSRADKMMYYNKRMKKADDN